jgi:uncharacterized membrane protein YhaH (DUF805 family)
MNFDKEKLKGYMKRWQWWVGMLAWVPLFLLTVFSTVVYVLTEILKEKTLSVVEMVVDWSTGE